MKTLYVDCALTGHHITYMNALTSINKPENIILALPQNYDNPYKTYVIPELNCKSKKDYITYISKLKKIAIEEKVDTIHFLFADMLLNFYGFKLGFLKKYKTICTIHHLRRSFKMDFAIKRVFKKITVGVVHTSTILNTLNSINIKNVAHIEYPLFKNYGVISHDDALEKLSLDKRPVLLCLGGTRHDKGLDILLEALNNVKTPFQLVIAGREQDFTRQFISDKINNYRDSVKTDLKFLSDDELIVYLNACDFIVLPYRYSFNGASGPLSEGVSLKKVIIGPTHGSVGDIIRQNHIGYTFKTENIDDLAKVLNTALESKFVFDETANIYIKSLNLETFISKYKKLYGV